MILISPKWKGWWWRYTWHDDDMTMMTMTISILHADNDESSLMIDDLNLARRWWWRYLPFTIMMTMMTTAMMMMMMMMTISTLRPLPTLSSEHWWLAALAPHFALFSCFMSYIRKCPLNKYVVCTWPETSSDFPPWWHLLEEPLAAKDVPGTWIIFKDVQASALF